MATYTTNLNLKKPAQSDKIRIADFNGNADNIDDALGADFGQSSKPSVNDEVNSLAAGMAIISNGDVHAAITSGQFVYVRGHSTLDDGLYVASSNISANGALSSSNLDADTSGGLNTLNTKMATLSNGSHTFWATLSQNAYQGTYFAQISGNFKGKTITKHTVTALSGTSSYNITNDTSLSVIDDMQINISTTASGLGGCPITVKVTVADA